jgi:hypothetical protein
MDACLEPSAKDTLPTLEIRLHIAINIISRLNAAEDARSLSVEELLLREFLLDQMLFLQELLEPSLVPRFIEELLGWELVDPPTLGRGHPKSSDGGGQDGRGRSVAVVDAYPEPSAMDILLMLEIWLHIIINITSHLNAVEETRLLSVEELSLHEFLLDQILFLQELLELSLLPRIINELLGRELVAPPPSFKDIPSPPRVEGRVAERCSVAVCTPGPLLAGASVLVVRDPTEAHVLLPSSQALETRSSFVQFAMTQCFQYAMCHGKVVMSFKARSPEFVALGLGSAVPPPLTTASLPI